MNKLRGDHLKRWLKNRRVAIVGLGRSGISVARSLLKFNANLFLSEIEPRNKINARLPHFLKKVPGEFGSHSEKLHHQDLIVVSPGFNWNSLLLVEARKKGIPVWSELEFGYRLADFKEIVAVTGTNGKTTTVSLIGDIFIRDGKKTFVGGNIGTPLSDCGYGTQKFDYAVLEVSSYQLEGIESFHPRVAVVLNLTPDHLYRYGTMHRYAKAKERIFLNQTSKDFAVLNGKDIWCRKMAHHFQAKVEWFFGMKKVKRGFFFDRRNQKIISHPFFSDRRIEFDLPVHLPGLHNIENSCAAIASSLVLGVSEAAIRNSLSSFKGVEHRLEKVLFFKGVTYVNDSKATNVDSTIKALQSFSQPIWLIMGGQDKGSPYFPLKPFISKKVKGIFLIGEASKKIVSELQGSCEIFFSKKLEKAVLDSSKKAVRGDLVLLSPACASFDQFKNFEDRGNQFKQLVKKIARR